MAIRMPLFSILKWISIVSMLASILAAPSTDPPDQHTSFDFLFNFTSPPGFFHNATFAEVRYRATSVQTEPATSSAVPVSIYDGTYDSLLLAVRRAEAFRRDFVYVDLDCAKIDGRIFDAVAESGAQILCNGTSREIYARVVAGAPPVQVPYNITDNGGGGHPSQHVRFKEHRARGLVVQPTPTSLLYEARGNNTVFLHISAPAADAQPYQPVWRATLIEWIASNGVSMDKSLLIARIE